MPSAPLVAEEALDLPRHFLLDRRQWRDVALDGVERDPAGALRLRALPGSGRPLVDQAGTFGGLTEPTGVAVDPWGRIYVSDAAADVVKRFDPCCGAFESLPCLGRTGGESRRLREPRGLAVSRSGLLYVVDAGNRRVQVFWLKRMVLSSILGPVDAQGRRTGPHPPPPNGQPECRAGEVFPEGTWDPFDVAIDSCEWALVSDRANGLIHRFDRHGRWRGALDGKTDANPGLSGPTHLAVDLQDRLYVAQDHADFVLVLDREGDFLGKAEPPEFLAGRFRPGPVATDAAGNLYVADRASRRLYAYCCTTAPGIPVRFAVAPCSLQGAVAGLAFDANGNALATDSLTGRVICLDGPAVFATSGRMYTTALDSKRAACRWHRVALTGSMPQDGSVEVHTYTSEERKDEDEVLALPEDVWDSARAWSEPGTTEWDCLVLSPPARYCWLRFTFAGSGSSTPSLSAAQVHFPRRSSIAFLPAVYRSGPDGGDFLDRLLSMFDVLFASVEGTIDDLPSYFDPRSTPAGPAWSSAEGFPSGRSRDFLSWLASWLGLTLEGTWDVAKRRALVGRAVRLFAWRGTRRGLREAVRLVVGLDPDAAADLPVPGLVEDFQLRRWFFAGGATLGTHTTLWGKRIVDRLELGEHSTIGQFVLTEVNDPLRDPFHAFAHRFTVFVPARCGAGEIQRRSVERIVELSKPAHTLHRIEWVEPRFRVGIQATVGMDTAVSAYPDGVVAGERRLGRDAVLQDRPDERPSLAVGVRSQIGTTVL